MPHELHDFINAHFRVYKGASEGFTNLMVRFTLNANMTAILAYLAVYGPCMNLATVVHE